MKKIITVLLFLVSVTLFAQVKIIEIDLSDTQIKTSSTKISSGDYQFIIKNMVKHPDYYYKIDAQKINQLIEPLDFQVMEQFDNKSLAQEFILDSIMPCDSLLKKYNTYLSSLYEKTDENELRNALIDPNLSKLVQEINETCNKFKVLQTKLIANLFVTKLNFNNLTKGQEINIVIKKFKKGEEKPIHEWERKFLTDKRGKWITTFGVGSAYTPNTWKRTYRTVKTSDSTYVLEADGRRNHLSYYPTVQFTYINELGNDWEIAPSGGISINSEQISAYGGISVVWAENMVLTMGAIFHKVHKLDNRFKEMDVFVEQKTFDDLHDEMFNISPFLSLSFRFNNNPFSKNDEK